MKINSNIIAAAVLATGIVIGAGAGAGAASSYLISGSQIAAHTVTTRQMAPSTVSYLRASNAGPRGATGASGADGVSGYTIVSIPNAYSAMIKNGDKVYGIAYCPPGDIAIGGGGQTSDPNSSLTENAPMFANGATTGTSANAWHVTFEVSGGAANATGTFEGYAVCAVAQ